MLLLKLGVVNQRFHIGKYITIEWIACVVMVVAVCEISLCPISWTKMCRTWRRGNIWRACVETCKSSKWIDWLVFSAMGCLCFSVLLIGGYIHRVLERLCKGSFVRIAPHPFSFMWISFKTFFASNIASCIIDLKNFSSVRIDITDNHDIR